MTNPQRLTLAFYAKFRDSNPRFRDVLAFNRRLVIYWAVVLALAAALAIWVPSPWTWFVVGVVAGAAMRDFRRMASTARVWPWARELINWEEVDRRLGR